MAFNPSATARSLSDLRSVIDANPQSTTKAAPVAPHKENTVNKAIHTLAPTPVATTPTFEFIPRLDETTDPGIAIRQAEKTAWAEKVRETVLGTMLGAAKAVEFLFPDNAVERMLESAGISVSNEPPSAWRTFANQAREIYANPDWFKDGNLVISEVVIMVPRMDKDALRFFRSADKAVEVVLMCKDDKSRVYSLFAVHTKDDSILHQWDFELHNDEPRTDADFTLSSELVADTDAILGSIQKH